MLDRGDPSNAEFAPAVPTPLSDVGYLEHTGKHLLVLSLTGFGPGADVPPDDPACLNMRCRYNLLLPIQHTSWQNRAIIAGAYLLPSYLNANRAWRGGLSCGS